jgi:YegS/Rv2252/BmrU family lipid kinase
MYNFIVNPNAGSGRGWKIWKEVSRYLDRNSIEYEASITSTTGDARAIARELTEGTHEPRYILVIGGDGTMNEVLDGVSFHSPLNLGYIPAGTGNDLARSLHLPRNIIKCLKKQLSPRHLIMVDYGVLSYGQQEVSHRRFMVSAGIGYDAAVCHAALTSRMRQCMGKAGLRKLSYIALGIRQFFRCKSSKGYIVLDGVKKVEFNHILFISCHIRPTEGGGFLFAPGADASDGKMEICVVSHSSRAKLIPFLLSSAKGYHGKKYRKRARSYECSEVKIHTEAPLPVHVDGEFCGYQTDIQAGCIARKVRMMV